MIDLNLKYVHRPPLPGATRDPIVFWIKFSDTKEAWLECGIVVKVSKQSSTLPIPSSQGVFAAGKGTETTYLGLVIEFASIRTEHVIDGRNT